MLSQNVYNKLYWRGHPDHIKRNKLRAKVPNKNNPFDYRLNKINKKVPLRTTEINR